MGKRTLISGALLVLAWSHAAAAHEQVFVATLSGPAEFPANLSPGVGSAVVVLDLDLITMRVEVAFSGLQGNVTASHIHGITSEALTGTAGVATQLPTFSGFPLGVTSGTYDHTFDLAVASSYNPAFITASGGTVGQALNALIFGLGDGKMYLNIHTSSFGGGEIRGFLLPTPKADFNHDGVVDGDDLDVWTESYGVDHEGDTNDDEATDGTDFLNWQRQLGSVAGLGDHGDHHVAAVPEPSAAVLAIWAGLAVAGLAGRRNRRCSRAPGNAFVTSVTRKVREKSQKTVVSRSSMREDDGV